ncbi:MAG: Phosphatidate cytidylyltransferase (EC [uncultured Campylobacterales bacterium]|uniref:Phosphatidate cytidylyltransferase n=1 Tax=uncultured Campylobacterales bacterium TaxID=352960 RepID=A0A6S6SZZ0_9BACT|nr:MAG: Phosphatidate cytidylyltransferase (EC [uncultured Campylobacterales bacterium]
MELRNRLLTSLGFLIFFIILYMIDNTYFTWLSLGIAYILALLEAKSLFGLTTQKNYIYIIGGVFWVCAIFFPSLSLVALFVVLYISVCLYKNKTNFDEIKLFLYPSVSFILMFMLYVNYGMYTFIWLVLVVAIADSGAYFVGKKFGKTKFSEISPNKTLEGFFGAIVLGTIIGAFISPNYISFISALVISFVTTFVSIYGDLFQSYLKRKVGLKDSGNILPGHGGILDRVDGHMFGVVAMYTLLSMIV